MNNKAAKADIALKIVERSTIDFSLSSLENAVKFRGTNCCLREGIMFPKIAAVSRI